MKSGKQTREKILDAANDLFCQKGLFKTTLDEIAERAGVAKGTIYLYIDRKEDLLVLIVRRGIDQIMEQMKALVFSELPPDVQLRVAYEAIYRRVSHLRQPGAMLSLTEFYGLPPDIIQKINEQKRRPMKVIEDIVARGIRRKVFKRSASPRFVAFLFFAYLGALLHREWIPPGIEPDEAGAEFWKFVRSALMR